MQFHSNNIGQSVTVYREDVRQRTAKHPSLVMAFSDTFAVIGVLLALAAVAPLFARKARPGGGAAGAH